VNQRCIGGGGHDLFRKRISAEGRRQKAKGQRREAKPLRL
jgi:hypothetical protein